MNVPPTEPLHIHASALDRIIEHAQVEAPNECCGLLIGLVRQIEIAWPARNVRASPTTFMVHPQDHFQAIRAARAKGAAVVGAYHSHPASPAAPSPTDAAEAFYSDFFYLIVSLADPAKPDVQAYLLFEGNFHPLRLVAHG